MQLETGTDTVLGEIADGVGVVTLNRPERRNALHRETYRAVPELLERFEHDPEVGCILITGTGTAFCAGGDVRGGGGRRDAEREAAAAARSFSVEEGGARLAHDARMVVMLHRSAKVTMAALPGPAVGAGIGIALSTDLRIAARSTKFVPGWGALAFSGDFGGTWFLTRLLGSSRALEFLVGDVPIEAEAAERLGLVNRVVADEDLADEAMRWARSIASKPRTAQRYLKQNIRQAEMLPLEQALPLEAERMARSATTDEHRAAVQRWLAAARAKKQRS